METDSSSLTPRRANLRLITKPKKYSEFLETSTKRRHVVHQYPEDDEFPEASNTLKPTALFDNEDVEGQDMFKFKSRHTRLDLQNKVKAATESSPKTASPLTTPRRRAQKARTFTTANEATPKCVRDVIRKRIAKEVERDSEDNDFSDGSSSDFVPDESDVEMESSSGSNTDGEDVDPKPKYQFITGNKFKPKDSEYIVTPDDYFRMNSTKKISTSDHTLAGIKNLNLNNREEDIELPEVHKSQLKELNRTHDDLFNKWLCALINNFSVILYGIGSKRSVLQKFQLEKLESSNCIVINGFFPSLTMKNILEAIVMDFLGNSNVPNNVADVVNLIDTQLNENDIELYLVIHNIDGIMLHSGKIQKILAAISHINKVHTICSIDHINAPLLWDHSKLSKFNFKWWDVTTFLPYTAETSFENSLMTHRSGVMQLSSLKSVYQSLTSNARGIFTIIIQYQLDNYKQTHYQGLPFRDLYSKSREQFLVSSDLALRAQLTEFLDHKLVKMRRTFDGSENLIIPIDNGLLQQFLDTQNP